MWPDLTHLIVHPLDLAFRSVVVFLVVLLLLRVSGKRQLGQMGATELVALLLISNAVQNSMNAGDSSLIGGLISAVVLIFLSWLISFVTYKSAPLRNIFEGTPTLLIHNGEPVKKHLAIERMSLTELRTLLRKQGVHHFHEVQTAVLEADGTLTLTRINEPAYDHHRA